MTRDDVIRAVVDLDERVAERLDMLTAGLAAWQIAADPARRAAAFTLLDADLTAALAGMRALLDIAPQLRQHLQEGIS